MTLKFIAMLLVFVGLMAIAAILVGASRKKNATETVKVPADEGPKQPPSIDALFEHFDKEEREQKQSQTAEVMPVAHISRESESLLEESVTQPKTELNVENEPAHQLYTEETRYFSNEYELVRMVLNSSQLAVCKRLENMFSHTYRVSPKLKASDILLPLKATVKEDKSKGERLVRIMQGYTIDYVLSSLDTGKVVCVILNQKNIERSDNTLELFQTFRNLNVPVYVWDDALQQTDDEIKSAITSILVVHDESSMS